jgi:DNA-binding transcriptional ArsR family regulator
MPTELQEKLKSAELACACLKVLSHPIRLLTLCTLQDGPKSVQELEHLLETPQATMSQHLNVLKSKDILLAERRSRQVFYSVKDPRTFELIGLLQTIYCKP